MESSREDFFLAMVVAYGRPFTENKGLGPIKCDYPGYPDFSIPELNLAHNRLIDIRNKFLAHSSAEGTKVMIVPPDVRNPVTKDVLGKFDHNAGKRSFIKPEYASWLAKVVFAFKERLDIDVTKQIEAEFYKQSISEPFELETKWDDFSWKE